MTLGFSTHRLSKNLAVCSTFFILMTCLSSLRTMPSTHYASRSLKNVTALASARPPYPQKRGARHLKKTLRRRRKKKKNSPSPLNHPPTLVNRLVASLVRFRLVLRANNTVSTFPRSLVSRCLHYMTHVLEPRDGPNSKKSLVGEEMSQAARYSRLRSATKKRHSVSRID